MKIAILTNFSDFNPGYSLTGICKDQVRMLLEHGHEPHLFVSTHYNPKYDTDMPKGVILHKEVPFGHLKDYKTARDLTVEHKAFIKELCAFMTTALEPFDMAWTHDWLLQSWCLPFALAIREASLSLPKLRWLHWLHSLPCSASDWWDIQRYGPRHKLVSPTKVERQRVAEAYHGGAEDVRVIPHTKDPRSWFDFDDDTCAIIRDYPNVMQGDIVQVYPASADRLSAKQVDKVIQIFSHFKRMGARVCLLCADQWATGKAPRENEERMLELARAVGLTDQEFAFTSRWADGKYALGLPKRILRELMLCANLMIFPTVQESFGLVGPEAALCGNFIVANKSLDNQAEVFAHQAFSFDFGSFHRNFEPANWDEYLRAVAAVILRRMDENEAVCTKTRVRKMYNYDCLYDSVYLPIMEESKHWAGGPTA